MKIAAVADVALPPTDIGAECVGVAETPPPSPSELTVSVCVACCSAPSLPNNTMLAVANAIRSLANVRTILLAENEAIPTDDIDVVEVSHGTKLAKLRRLADVVDADLFCICDPDLSINGQACRQILLKAIADIRAGQEVVAFGLVDGRKDGTLLSRIVAVDKWLSHRVIRPSLWAAKLGLTLPGQFLILSPALLRSIDGDVDSYLDDLCLGWFARWRGACIHRVPVVVGEEDSRTRWTSLLTQRMRWMRGLASLFRHLSSNPAAMGLLSIHYLAYHALPIILMATVLVTTIINPLAAIGILLSLAALLSACSRQSFIVVLCFVLIFPIVHLLATLLWWMPFSRTMLRRR